MRTHRVSSISRPVVSWKSTSRDSAERFVVKGVLEDGGFAGIDSTMIISLDRAQEIFGRTGQITSIVISKPRR